VPSPGGFFNGLLSNVPPPPSNGVSVYRAAGASQFLDVSRVARCDGKPWVSTHGGTNPILTRREATLEIEDFYALQSSLRDGRVLGPSPRLEYVFSARTKMGTGHGLQAASPSAMSCHWGLPQRPRLMPGGSGVNAALRSLAARPR
jgi:hypothetical protein